MPVVTLSKGNTVIKDNYINEALPSTVQNYTLGGIYVAVDSASKKIRSLLKFDLGLIPNDAIINSATLELYQAGNGGVSRVIDVNKVTSDWADNTVTWDTQPTFDPTPVASVLFDNTSKYFSFDVKNLVQDWVNGSSQNFGFLIKDTDETVQYTKQITSVDAASNQPKLTIDYTIPSTGKKQVEYVGTGTHYYGTATSATFNFPAGIQTGDLLVCQFMLQSDTAVLTMPSGWTPLINVTGNTSRYVIATKVHDGTGASFQASASSSVAWAGAVHAFRNVKAVQSSSSRLYTSGSSTKAPSTTNITVSTDDTMLVLLNNNFGGTTYTPPLSYKEGFESATTGIIEMAFRYMHGNRIQTVAEMTSTTPGSVVDISQLLVLEPIQNTLPTLTLTNPANNLVLSEGMELPVEGYATEADVNDPVTIYLQVNNGTPVAVHSDVSDGSTAINFAKNLTYSDKRIYLGTTDLTGSDLAENTFHELKVWAEDNKGGKSDVVTKEFSVIWNRPPQIDGSNGDLGELTTPPSVNYVVTEPEGNAFTITEMLNGVTKRTFSGTAGQQNTFTISEDDWLRLPLDVPHEMRIRATDSGGVYSDRVYTFVRKEDRIVFELDYSNPDVQNFFTTDEKANRILVSIDGVIPSGADIIVEVCNNAYDAVPTFEDMTGPFKTGRGYIFQNTTKTAAQWGINIRITVLKGTATEPVIINGFGGAFD